MAYFDNKRFREWEEKTTIPKNVMDMVNWIAEKIGYPVYEETISIKNRMGATIGFAKGFVVSYCTSSLECGPCIDYTPEFIKWLKWLGFEVENGYGDNGLDSATNWHDTYWHNEIIYKPSVTYDDFIVFNPSENYYEDEDY